MNTVRRLTAVQTAATVEEAAARARLLLLSALGLAKLKLRARAFFSVSHTTMDSLYYTHRKHFCVCMLQTASSEAATLLCYPRFLPPNIKHLKDFTLWYPTLFAQQIPWIPCTKVSAKKKNPTLKLKIQNCLYYRVILIVLPSIPTSFSPNSPNLFSTFHSSYNLTYQSQF